MKILEHYKPCLDFEGQYCFLLSGAGTGKSYFMAQKIIIDCLSKPNKHWLCTRKTHSNVSRSVYSEIIGILQSENLTKYYTTSKTSKSIQFYNNSKITCTGVDEPNKIKSIAGVTNSFLEEVDEMKPEDVDLVLSRVRSGSERNQNYMAFNPPEEQSWIALRWFQGGKVIPNYNEPYYWTETEQLSTGDSVQLEYIAFRSHYEFNPYLKPETRASYENLKKLNYSLYESLCLGTWITNSSSTFFDKEFYQEKNNSGKNIIYIDSSYNSSTGKGDFACVIKVSFNQNEYYVNKVFLEKGCSILQIYQAAESFYDINSIGIHYDGNFYQPEIWKQFQSNFSTIKMTPEKGSTNKLIPEVLNLWNMKKIWMPEGFSQTKTGQESSKQLFNFTNKNSNKEHDDFPDALIWAIHLLNQKNNIKTLQWWKNIK